MNSMLCLFFKDREALRAAITNLSFINITGKHRCFVFLEDENRELTRSAIAVKNDPEIFLQLSVITAYECIVPYLIDTSDAASNSLREKITIVGMPQKFWIGDIDIWLDFPECYVDALKPLFPQAKFLVSGDA